MGAPEGGFAGNYLHHLDAEARENCGWVSRCGLQNVRLSAISDPNESDVLLVRPELLCYPDCPYTDDKAFDDLHKRASAKAITALGLTGKVDLL